MTGQSFSFARTSSVPEPSAGKSINLDESGISMPASLPTSLADLPTTSLFKCPS